MSLIPDPPAPGDKPDHPLTETALAGRLTMDGHPLTGMSFGVAGTIMPLVDLRLEERRLPDYMRSTPKAGR